MQPTSFVPHVKERLALDSKKYARMRTLWLVAYRYYGVLLHPDQESLYAEDMMAYAVEDVAAALRTYRLTPPPENQKPRPPMPVDLMPLLTGGCSLNAQAGEMASAIAASLNTYGHPNMEKAKAHLGPVAWDVVKTLGGWSYLCRETDTKNSHLFHAQARELAKTALARHRTEGLLGHAQPAPAVLQAQPTKQLPAAPMVPSTEPRRLPAPSRAVDDINAMVARLAARLG